MESLDAIFNKYDNCVDPFKIQKQTNNVFEYSIDKIEFIGDRPANDKHYAIDSGKIQRELGWKPQIDIEEGFKQTIKHYINKFRKIGN